MKQPTIFISHGGGPCFWMEFGAPFGPHGFDKLRAYLAGLLATLPERPKAILAHLRPLGRGDAHGRDGRQSRHDL